MAVPPRAVYRSYDFRQNPIYGLVAERMEALPAAPAIGRIVWSDELGGLAAWDGSAWIRLSPTDSQAGAANLAYFHNQPTPAATWVIAHGLGRHPSVVVTDSAGNRVEGDERHDTVNQVTLSFSVPFGGSAWLN